MTLTRSDTEMQRKTVSTFRALADALASRSDDDWNTASLCAGWRIREVIAHVTMPARYTTEEFMKQLEAHQFDFDRLSNEFAARDGALPIAELVANLRSQALHEWTPPGGGHHGALNHAVIHGLDATVPLNASGVVDDETITVVLDDLAAGGVHTHFGTVLDGHRLEASDIAWSYGSGQVLSGPSRELALAVCGRTIPNGHLEGTPI